MLLKRGQCLILCREIIVINNLKDQATESIVKLVEVWSTPFSLSTRGVSHPGPGFNALRIFLICIFHSTIGDILKNRPKFAMSKEILPHFSII
jgi:hypothetical protein